MPLDDAAWRMASPRAIDNARVVTPDGVLDRASVIIEEGRIAGVSRRTQGGQDALDAAGRYVLPGLVDLHGDDLEKQLAPRPGVEMPEELAFLEADRLLAASGITTGFHAISFRESGDRTVARGHRMWEMVLRLRDDARVRHEPHPRCELTQEESAKAVCGVLQARVARLASLADHTPGQGQYHDLAWYRRYQKEHRGATDDEVDEAIASATDDGRDVRERAGRVARLAGRHGVVLASHDDDTSSKVEEMARLGVGISEFPITPDSARRARECGMYVCLGAPNVVRGRSSSGNLSATRAVELGLVDFLCSDYHPPSLLQAAFGLARQKRLTLPQAVDLVASGPARAVGMSDRGGIQTGTTADLLLVSERLGLPETVQTLVGGAVVYASSSRPTRRAHPAPQP